MTDKPERRSLLLPILVSGVAIALIVLVLALRSGEGSSPRTFEEAASTADSGEDSGEAPTAVDNPDEPDLTMVERRDPDDPLAAGPVEAPVTLVVFSDYQCPFCASWNADTLPALLPYVEAGDLRIEWRDVQVYGEDSERASRAAYAAAQQGEFSAYHDALFAGGETRSGSGLSEGSLVDLAAELGLDVDQFTTDLGSEETTTAVEENAEVGYSLGVYNTPAFLIGGEPILGAQPTDVFVSAYEQALTEAG
ncbi:DsbA family protein [Ruania albidiflava]|uniref:DsbA family protein n=1 Tax=Ruania albidiflava TaxID=366586 RepID=UPI0003B4AD4D|nr:thioredoxin domain-containing protein [Ruania albidiflava]